MSGSAVSEKNYKASDANDYEKSDVKKFVDAWFEIVMEDMEYQEEG